MSQPQVPAVDYNEIAARFRQAETFPSRHQHVNELLVDVRDWQRLPEDELAARFADDPAACAAAWELTEAGRYLDENSLSDTELIKPFTDRSFLKRYVYLGLHPAPSSIPSIRRTFIIPRHDKWDTLVYIQAMLRWAERFGHWQPRNRRDLKRINLQFPFMVAIVDVPETMEEMLAYAVLQELGVRMIVRDPGLPAHHLQRWLEEKLEIRGVEAQQSQRSLDFREAGTSRNSVFVVRAMGGVDGYDVRGNIGEDLGLIIDIGDKEVTRASTAYLEDHVVRIINERTELRAEKVDQRLVLRWYDTRMTPDDIGRIIHDALKERFVLAVVSVSLLFDPIRISSLQASIFSYVEERRKELKQRSEESEPFILCRSCSSYSPHAFCIVSVERPPCCHRTYDELSSLAQYTRGTQQITMEKGICLDKQKGCYMGTDKLARYLSEQNITRVNLHSIREYPHPTTALAECIAWYVDELDSILIISLDYHGRSPDGKTFNMLLARITGQQTPGTVGISERYILSSRFMQAEGGLARVGWMNSELKQRLGIRVDAIATEKDCTNLAGLKSHLATWRH